MFFLIFVISYHTVKQLSGFPQFDVPTLLRRILVFQERPHRIFRYIDTVEKQRISVGTQLIHGIKNSFVFQFVYGIDDGLINPLRQFFLAYFLIYRQSLIQTLFSVNMRLNLFFLTFIN